jgi:RNA polymerase sigma-70 factor, ECF subfamily
MVPAPDDLDLLARLRAGEAAAFRTFVSSNHASMVRVASTFVPTQAVAEEVAQEAWLAVISGLDGFEGRSSLRTWTFQILVNKAKTRGARERRTVPESSLGAELADGSPSVGVERFAGPDGRGMWSQPPSRWSDRPEASFDLVETFGVLEETIRDLPENQRRVLVLRDVEGWSSAEVRELLELSESNQRVLLHRARSRVRAAFEVEFGGGE